MNNIRDIFVFQCLIGCRVSDLFNLTQGNVRGAFVEYIPQKCSHAIPKVVRVPLTHTAKEILQKHAKIHGDFLLPRIAHQQYNYAIKDLIRLGGIHRLVTVLDTQTRKEVNKPIYEIATSHMARRTFIGNLYNKVQDPNLIASMSGHTEGSKAFIRYRAINDKVKRYTIKFLEGTRR